MIHTLTIGCTGMLLKATQEMIRQSRCATICSRTASEKVQASETIQVINHDYRDVDELIKHVRHQQETFGPIDLALFWIHGTEPDVVLRVSEVLNEQTTRAHVYEVHGSAIKKPANPDVLSVRRHGFSPLQNIAYHAVVLGFKRTNDGTRWLTDDEISLGTLAAIEQGRDEYVVGETEPWEERP